MSTSKQLSYTTGEPIIKGDSVRFGQWDAVVSGVVQPDSPEWDDYGGVSLSGAPCGLIRLEHIH
jgi:hypothetical protein